MKIGDKVRVIADYKGYTGLVGELDEIVVGNYGDYSVRFKSLDKGIHYQWFYEHELELIEKDK